jgi:hypothetical protein
MTLSQFLSEPWRNSHDLYSGSSLAMTPAPEYASSEVILSSLYRVAGYQEFPEGEVPQRGRDLDRLVQHHRDKQVPRENAALDPSAFLGLLHAGLESPKLPNQSSKRFLQVTPLVPGTARFSGSARLAGNPWSAGTLVRRLVWLGSASPVDARVLWDDLFAGLSVNSDDDIFARFLALEIDAWADTPSWEQAPVPENLPTGGWPGIAYPARQLAGDLRAVLDAKGLLTRRQWTSLLEAILRIGTVSHVAWICDVHARTWRAIRAALNGDGPVGETDAADAMFPAQFSYLSFGDKAIPQLKDRASQFLIARLGLNLVLWTLAGHRVEHAGGLGSPAEVSALLDSVRANRAKLADIPNQFHALLEREGQTLLCKKGIGSNMIEFGRHALGQRQSANELLRGYDQGFALRKKSASRSSPIIVSLGPVATLALVHCALAGARGPRSVKRLAQHLSGYGITVDPQEIGRNDLGQQLRMLGLVLDSPDAESGMLLVPPFASGIA